MTKSEFINICDNEGWDNAIKAVNKFTRSTNIWMLPNELKLKHFKIRICVLSYLFGYKFDDYEATTDPDHGECYKCRSESIEQIGELLEQIENFDEK